MKWAGKNKDIIIPIYNIQPTGKVFGNPIIYIYSYQGDGDIGKGIGRSKSEIQSEGEKEREKESVRKWDKK